METVTQQHGAMQQRSDRVQYSLMCRQGSRIDRVEWSLCGMMISEPQFQRRRSSLSCRLFRNFQLCLGTAMVHPLLGRMSIVSCVCRSRSKRARLKLLFPASSHRSSTLPVTRDQCLGSLPAASTSQCYVTRQRCLKRLQYCAVQILRNKMKESKWTERENYEFHLSMHDIVSAFPFPLPCRDKYTPKHQDRTRGPIEGCQCDVASEIDRLSHPPTTWFSSW